MKSKLKFKDVKSYDEKVFKKSKLEEEEFNLLLRQYNTYMFIFNKLDRFDSLDAANETMQYLNKCGIYFE